MWNFAGPGNGQYVETGGPGGGERRHDSPDGRSLAVVVPCAGRGFKGRVLSLASVYGPVSGAGFDDERRVMFDSLSAILGLLPERSVWIIGGDFNAEIGYRGVGEENTLGVHARGRRTRSGRQMMEWAQGEALRFLLSFSRQACRDTWFHPKSFTGHAIDHLLCRSRDHKFLGAAKVLFEETVGAAWSAYTDHNPVEVKLAKGWVFRAPLRTPRRLRRPHWVALRGSGEAAKVARSALATELDRRVADEQPTTWPEVVSLGLGVARAVLGEEPKKDPRPWVHGCEKELVTFDQATRRLRGGMLRPKRFRIRLIRGMRLVFLLLLRSYVFGALRLLWVTFVLRRFRVNATHGQNIFV